MRRVNAIERDKALAWVERNIKVPLTEPQKRVSRRFAPITLAPVSVSRRRFISGLMPVIVKVPVSRFAGGLRTVGVIAAHVQITATDRLFVVTRKRISLLGDRSVRRVAAIISALVICIIVCLSWAVNHYRDNAITYKAQRDKNARELKLANAAITDMQMRQRDVAALDAKYTKELADAKAENDALRDDVAAGRRRLHIKAVCQSVREATTASGVDNAASPDWQTPLNRIISPSERG